MARSCDGATDRLPGGFEKALCPCFPATSFCAATTPPGSRRSPPSACREALPVPDGARLVHDLRQVWRLLASDAPLEPEARLEPGRRVRVRSGSMLGLEGTVVKRRGKDWLVVVVEFLQQGVSVLLEDFQVEPV